MGLDKEGQEFVKACEEATEQAGLCHVLPPEISHPQGGLNSDEMRFVAHIAWGRFIAARCVILIRMSHSKR